MRIARHWFWRRTIQQRKKENAQWGSLPTQRAILKESCLIPPPNFNSPKCHLLRRTPWPCGKEFQMGRVGAESWKKNQKSSPQRLPFVFASFSQVGVWILANFKFSMCILVYSLYICKSGSRLPQLHWVRSLMSGLSYMSLPVSCRFTVMSPVFSVCLYSASLLVCPCAGHFVVMVENHIVMFCQALWNRCPARQKFKFAITTQGAIGGPGQLVCLM